MAHDPFDIKPVERNCICDGADTHSAECNEQYRNDFYALWTHTRKVFYEENPPVVDGSMN